MCITDENEILLWGKNILDSKSEQVFDEPILVCKVEEHLLNLTRNDNQILDRIFQIRDVGIITLSRQSNLLKFFIIPIETEKDEILINSG